MLTHPQHSLSPTHISHYVLSHSQRNHSSTLTPISSFPLTGGPVTYALEGSVAYAGLLIQVHGPSPQHITYHFITGQPFDHLITTVPIIIHFQCHC